MKLATYSSPSGPRACAVREVDGELCLVDLQENDESLPASLKELLAIGKGAMEKAQRVAEHGKPLAIGLDCLLPPIPNPRKILCVGGNYAEHAAESSFQVGGEPIIFNKLPTTIRGNEDSIVLPKESCQVDYEAELVVVIGRQGKHVPHESWADYVAGYTCGNDISARDWQTGKPGKQWLLGKSFDSFAPTGPFLVTPDEIGPAGQPPNVTVRLRLNGELMQAARTDQLVFGVDYLIAYLSNICTLEPGDLIFTGTPSGVGMARTPPVFLQPGDVTEVQIEGVGTLRNSVVKAE